MKTKFFLCIRPPVIETDDGDYTKPPPPPFGSSYTSGKISRRSNRDSQQRKRAAPEKFNYIRQLSLKSSGNISEGKSENQVQKDSPKAPKITRSVSESCVFIKFSHEESVSLKKARDMNTSNDKVSGESNSGAYLMVSSLFFTVFSGKFFGIICTILLVCCLYRYPHGRNGGNDSRKSEYLVVNSPEKGSQEYKKRVIMDGLLERKSHYRENMTLWVNGLII